jgi:pyruvate dehydrogenase kinase 2/3/4
MSELFEFGRNPSRTTLLLAAQFLHEELPIRLAQRVRALRTMPLGFSETPSVNTVRLLYEESFKRLKSLPKPRNDEQVGVRVSLVLGVNERFKVLIG